MIIVSENRFSGKTYLYTIASRMKRKDSRKKNHQEEQDIAQQKPDNENEAQGRHSVTNDYVHCWASRHSLGFEDEDLGSSPAYCTGMGARMSYRK